ncbi:hypothetical protein FNT36_16820 [Hymenobacter setariae]|uniref:Signal transduction histidine kinase internal region domain-containing protein n=1 Tax=Hymenobacter setariae TaxID=2594794 RepID=A0A558BS35_9BACT|nr:sensor histidine kinase [Hymenobacter setariae]TVT39318.1 hypothetical protein FNT36_16820 [Hymenobacter setariae]
MFSFLPATRLFRHLLFWGAMLVYFGVPQGIYPDYRNTVASYFFGFNYQQSPHFLPILFGYVLGVGLLYAYAFRGWVLPPLLAGRLASSLGRFVLLTLGICYLFRLLSALHVAWLDPWLRHLPAQPLDPRHFQGLFVNQVYIHEYGTVILLIATYKLLQNWQRQQQAAGQLVREQARAELQLLKAQLHPQLLLGSLSTLERLLDEQDPQAPGLLLTLSQFLRYVLYDSQAEYVPLSQDLSALQQYLTLEQARLGQQLEVSFHVAGQANSQPIAPLLWLPLLEQLLPQGTTADGPGWLSAQLTLTGNQLKMSFALTTALEETPAFSEPHLLALRRHLAARYADRHTLRLTPEPGLLLAVLTLELVAHSHPETPDFSSTYAPALPARR